MSIWEKMFGTEKHEKNASPTENKVDQGKTKIFGIEVKKLPPEILEEIEAVTRADPWNDTSTLASEICKRVFGINDLQKLQGLLLTGNVANQANVAQEALRTLKVASSYLNSFDVDPMSSKSPSEQRRTMFIHLVMMEVDRMKAIINSGR